MYPLYHASILLAMRHRSLSSPGTKLTPRWGGLVRDFFDVFWLISSSSWPPVSVPRSVSLSHCPSSICIIGHRIVAPRTTSARLTSVALRRFVLPARPTAFWFYWLSFLCYTHSHCLRVLPVPYLRLTPMPLALSKRMRTHPALIQVFLSFSVAYSSVPVARTFP